MRLRCTRPCPSLAHDTQLPGWTAENCSSFAFTSLRRARLGPACLHPSKNAGKQLAARVLCRAGRVLKIAGASAARTPIEQQFDDVRLSFSHGQMEDCRAARKVVTSSAQSGCTATDRPARACGRALRKRRAAECADRHLRSLAAVRDDSILPSGPLRTSAVTGHAEGMTQWGKRGAGKRRARGPRV